MFMVYDAETLTVQGRLRSFDLEAYLPEPNAKGAIGYAVPMRVDCAKDAIQEVSVEGIRADLSRFPDKPDVVGYEAVAKGTYRAALHKRMCAIAKREDAEADDAVGVQPGVAARAIFALIKLGLPDFQAAALATWEMEQADLDRTLEMTRFDPAKQQAIRRILAATTRKPPPPPPPIVPLASAVASGRVGRYVHSEMELVSGLWLKADGTFEYGLTVGTLDQTARGRWVVEGDGVRLANVPERVAPTITAGPATYDPKVALSVKVATPRGRVVDGVEVTVETGNGRAFVDSTSEDGLTIPVSPSGGPRFVTLAMRSFGVGPVRFPVAPRGNAMTFVFAPNDIGTADMSGAKVTFDPNGDLLLSWPGEQPIRFQKRR